ncbi:hypothetical protein F511_17769 [Dorcoceras hygrometricum]|uniref:Protein PHYTOCHROME KINASE SUBSTRATE 1-like n=1 Tax=Dorcoceras hygrometricum TaxID=472368 RepID=A0A2Z7AQW3_9LAMI|nr:hypothetical protein F511_17769 [Dorcoceras hygrometricum]
MSTSESGNKFRDSSFSSYLDGAEETFVLELRASKRDHAYLGRNRTTEDREIDVFDAKKYFTEGTSCAATMVGSKESPGHQSKKDDDPIQVSGAKDRRQIATPSLRSESSWNSGSGILHSVPTNKRPKEVKRRSFLANIGCNCSCSDKNSVEIGDFDWENCLIKSCGVQTSDHSGKKSLSRYDVKSRFLESERKGNAEGHFSFPVFNPKTGNQAARIQTQGGEEDDQDSTKRKSLEVFGAPILDRAKNRLSLDRKLSMLTWEALVPGVTEEIKIPSICSDLDNDSDSDASSDLFEIGSLSKGNSFLSRQASDGLPGCITPGNFYAPSEASIEWSVVTASAADFSIFSDVEELRSTTTNTTKTATTATMPNPHQPCPNNPRKSPLKEVPKRRSGILSGCKSEKAVPVARSAHISQDKGSSKTRNLLKSDTPKVPGFDPRKRQQSFEACAISKPHSGTASHLVYT